MKNQPQKYHVAIGAYPINFLKGLRDRHIPVQKLLSKSLLKHFSLDNNNIHLPIHVVYDFFEVARLNYGNEFFDPIALKAYNLKNMGMVGQYISSPNRVLSILQNEIKHSKLLCTNQDITIGIENNRTLLSNRFSGFSRFGKTAMEMIWLHMAIQTLKGSEGENWSPIRINLNGPASDYHKLMSFRYGTDIHFNQDHCGVLFETATLAKPIISKGHYEISENQLPRPAMRLSGMIEEMFENMYAVNLPSLQVAAEFFEVSVSTIKRHLASEGTTYYLLMERWRFMKGVSLLTETDLKVKEISECLYYSNPANFVRAFRRWCGSTPREFRNAV